MAEDIDVAQTAERPVNGDPLDLLQMRDEEGQIRHEFVEEIARAIGAAEAPRLREVVAELHEADLGDLIAALEPDDRVQLVELTGTDFDFSALNEGRRHRPRGNPRGTRTGDVAEGVRELESDDAVELLEGLDEEDQEEILEKLPPSERDALERSLLYPENSAGRGCSPSSSRCRRIGRWQAIDYMRDTPDLAGPVL
jgi:Mg/Co/Ni transporter MgtE (contains CBS domain)